jgi:hypothetical protein
VQFFATREDEERLLDYVGEPTAVKLFPWLPMRAEAPVFLNRHDRASTSHVGVLDPRLGRIELAYPGDPAFTDGSSRARVFNTTNWNNWQPTAGAGIVDWNTTPALFWSRGEATATVLTPSDIGSQADSIARISDEYRRWVNRVMNWVRRTGTKVWGPSPEDRVAGFDVDLHTVSTCFALPGAVAYFESGGLGRESVAWRHAGGPGPE